MQYDILLTKQPANGYLARPVLMPEIVVSGADEAEALARVREAIAKVTVQSRIVRIDVPSENDPTAVVTTSPLDNAEKLARLEEAATDSLFLADLAETMATFAHVETKYYCLPA